MISHGEQWAKQAAPRFAARSPGTTNSGPSTSTGLGRTLHGLRAVLDLDDVLAEDGIGDWVAAVEAVDDAVLDRLVAVVDRHERDALRSAAGNSGVSRGPGAQHGRLRLHSEGEGGLIMASCASGTAGRREGEGEGGRAP